MIAQCVHLRNDALTNIALCCGCQSPAGTKVLQRRRQESRCGRNHFIFVKAQKSNERRRSLYQGRVNEILSCSRARNLGSVYQEGLPESVRTKSPVHFIYNV